MWYLLDPNRKIIGNAPAMVDLDGHIHSILVRSRSWDWERYKSDEFRV